MQDAMLANEMLYESLEGIGGKATWRGQVSHAWDVGSSTEEMASRWQGQLGSDVSLGKWPPGWQGQLDSDKSPVMKVLVGLLEN